MKEKKEIKTEKDEGNFNLKELKKEYLKFKPKYKLPDFSDLNMLFDIEEIDFETDFLLRRIRRTISDRISTYIRFVEIIINPSNAPIFFFKLVKKLDIHDKELLTEVYEKLSHFEVEVIALDLEYSEKKEAEFIKKAHVLFNDEISKKLLEIINKLANSTDKPFRETNGSYVG
jgi:hypothetical protein